MENQELDEARTVTFCQNNLEEALRQTVNVGSYERQNALERQAEMRLFHNGSDFRCLRLLCMVLYRLLSLQSVKNEDFLALLPHEARHF